ncbi:uncharacterized protein [Heptranchias perlo]|uniref:uncharacterized protein isoform X2 n=1 Tax=Heptranchias perlo TaxID=212740 RepID=UPI0035594DEF
MLRGLMICFFVLLPGSVFTQEDPIDIYFPEGKRHIVLNGSDIPAKGTVVWEWTPHFGQRSMKTLVKMKAEGQNWRAERGSGDMTNNGIKWNQKNDSLDLQIENAAFEAAGLFTCRQTEPEERILKEYEIFIIKVERDPRYQFTGSDVTLNCTISRLADTASLQWKSRDSSQQNGRNNTDQIQLNNTVYLIVRDVQADDAERYACGIQDNGRTVLTVYIELYFSMSEFGKEYTSYWPIFSHNSLHLNCKSKAEYNVSVWYWKKHNHRTRRKVMSADRKEQRNTIILNYQNRISPPHFDGRSFPLQISPAQFEDAGTYRCSMNTGILVTIELITIKVTANPSHSLVEGDNVILTCSASHVIGATRLVWMENDRKILVKEKTFNPSGEGNHSLLLFIQEIGQNNRKWTCLVFNGTMPKIYITYQLEVNERNKIAYLNYILISVALVLLLCIIAAIMRRRINEPGPTQDEQCNLQLSDANQRASDGNE